MQRLTDGLAAKLGSHVTRPARAWKEIRMWMGLWAGRESKRGRKKEILKAQAVCLALPSYQSASLLANLDPDLAENDSPFVRASGRPSISLPENGHKEHR